MWLATAGVKVPATAQLTTACTRRSFTMPLMYVVKGAGEAGRWSSVGWESREWIRKNLLGVSGEWWRSLLSPAASRVTSAPRAGDQRKTSWRCPDGITASPTRIRAWWKGSCATQFKAASSACSASLTASVPSKRRERAGCLELYYVEGSSRELLNDTEKEDLHDIYTSEA